MDNGHVCSFTWQAEKAILDPTCMDNLRRPKHQKQSGAVDGFIRPRKKTARSGVGNFSNRPSTSDRRPLVANFKQSDGFQPTGQPALATAAVAANSLPGGQAIPAKPIATGKTRGRRQSKVKNGRRWVRIVKRTALVLLVLVIALGAFLGVKSYLKSRRVLKGGGSAAALTENVDPTRLKGEGDGRINILLLGKGGPGHDGPDLTDTLMIASIDPVHKEAALVSIPRDLWVKPAGSYGYTKINAVYADAKYAVLNGKKVPNQQQAAEDAGEKAVKQTVESTFGIPLHYYVNVDFEGFRKAIDTVGGVDINVKTKVYDPTVAWENNWNPVVAAVGQQHMDGKKALLYARSRHGSARGDFDRAERQRELMVAMKEKIMSAGTYGNPLKISQLLDAFGDHVSTNFSSNEVLRLYNIAKNIPSSKVTSVGLADPPNDYLVTGDVGGQSVVLPRAGVGNYTELQSYIRNTLKDSYIKDENASIIVLNGTNTPGLATTKGNELKSFGYNVIQIGDAPTKGYSQTQLIDLRNGSKKYTKHYLEGRLGVTATTKVPDGINTGNADFVIVLGSNTANGQ